MKMVGMREVYESFINPESLGGHACKLTVSRGGRDFGEVSLEWDHDPKYIACRLPIDLMREIIAFYDALPKNPAFK
jgi:hypothetical protein